MKIVRKAPDPKDLEWYQKSLTEKKSSRLRGLIFFALCVMLVFATIAYGAVDMWSRAVLSIFAGIIVLLWLTDSFIGKGFYFNTNFLQLPVLGLILIGFIQLLPLRGELESGLLPIPAAHTLSLDPNATQFFIILLIINLIFFAAALTFVDSLKKMRLMTFTIIIFGALMAFFGVIQSFTIEGSILGIRENPDAIPFGTFINRHHFAAFMNMTIGLTLGLLFGGATRKDKRLLLIITLVLMGIALILTGSRGGLLSLFGVVGFVVLINLMQKDAVDEFDEPAEKPSRFRRNFLLIGSGLALILVLFGAVLMLGGDSWLMRGVGLGTQGDVSNGRTHFWYVALQIILHNPILGTGLDSFGTAFPRYDTWNGIYRLEQAHNDYLQILSDAGIFGFLCVVWFIYLLFKQGLRIVSGTTDTFRKSVAVGALAGCFGIIIHSLFDFPLRTSSNGLFFLMLAALATVSLKDSESSTSKRRSRTKVKTAKSIES